MNTKNIVIYVEAIDHYQFFIRMEKVLRESGFNVIYITLKLSLFFRLKKRGFNCRLIRKAERNLTPEINFESIIEFKGKFQDPQSILRTYNSIYHLLEQIHLSENVGLMFIFGGYSVSGLVLEDFAAKHKIPKLYFELSNIPGKIFADPKGTNARSSISLNSNLLDEYSINESDFQIWRSGYVNSKLNQKDIPQSENIKPINWGYFLDWFGFLFLRIPKGANRGIFSQVTNKLLIKFNNLKPCNTSLTGVKYIFYPMQVSTDAQVLINSNWNNSEAIIHAYNLAKTENLILVIKPHTAEKSYAEIKKIKKLKKELGFIISDENTFKLITESEKVITINSTVGLESLILKKEVTVLGNSFYKVFTQEQVKKYLTGFLIDIDFFAKDTIPKEKIDIILKRIDLQL